METRPYQGPVDYERVSRYLRALSAPNRVMLLHKLQRPLAASEIVLPPFRKDRERSPDRPLSRQAVEEHLRKLQEVGLVQTRAAQRHGQPVTEYLVNQARLFVLADELRRLGHIRPAPSVASAHTAAHTASPEEAGGPPDAMAMPPGPALVAVSGPWEGRAFPLQGAGPWVVGRGADANVALAYDPFVSARNTEVWRDAGEGTFFARDLPTSRNGTMVNWTRLDKGAHVPLQAGDTVGMGRSLLLFRGA